MVIKPLAVNNTSNFEALMRCDHAGRGTGFCTNDHREEFDYRNIDTNDTSRENQNPKCKIARSRTRAGATGRAAAI